MNSTSAFPIKSATACLLKWGWSTLFLYTGRSNSCHRTTLSEMTSDQIGTFHNTPDKIRQRQVMLDGRWPRRGTGCEYCRDIEDAGGMSDRTTNLNLLAVDEDFRRLIPAELHENPMALEVTPTILEVYFTNRCNMSCIYCGPNFSSLWVEENKRYGQPEHHSGCISWQTVPPLNREYPEKLNNFWQWMETHYRQLKMFHVLGGEPFCQHETQDAIKFWYDHPNRQLDLKIVSNLKVAKEKLNDIVGELKKLIDQEKCRSISINASLDCWGPEQEYVRWGLDLSNWVENYENLIYHHPWLCVSVNCTINALSIRTMPILLRKMKVWQENRTRLLQDGTTTSGLSFVFNRLLGPRFMNAGIFPEGFFDEQFQQIIDLLPKNSQWENANVKYMQGIWKSVNASVHNPSLISELKCFLDEMDRRRGTNWRETFRWLADLG